MNMYDYQNNAALWLAAFVFYSICSLYAIPRILAGWGSRSKRSFHIADRVAGILL